MNGWTNREKNKKTLLVFKIFRIFVADKRQ